MNAEEARALQLAGKQNIRDRLYNEIIERIRKECALDKSSLTALIPDEAVIKRLVKDGYTVIDLTSKDTRNLYQITWNEDGKT